MKRIVLLTAVFGIICAGVQGESVPEYATAPGRQSILPINTRFEERISDIVAENNIADEINNTQWYDFLSINTRFEERGSDIVAENNTADEINSMTPLINASETNTAEENSNRQPEYNFGELYTRLQSNEATRVAEPTLLTDFSFVAYIAEDWRSLVESSRDDRTQNTDGQ